jgi:DNA mismatch repair protein MSH2
VINHANFESLLRHVLLVKHFRVDIFKFMAPKGGIAASYQLEVRASPGNISSIEHILYGEGEMGSRDTNFLVGIKLNPRLVGGQVSSKLAAVDMVKVSDFLDNEHFTNLETILVQLGPREVILPQTDNASVKKMPPHRNIFQTHVQCKVKHRFIKI